MAKVTAKLNYLHIAPRKVRLVANAIKGLSANEAEAQLLFRPKRSGGPLLKLLRSAVANAKNNQKLNPEKLVIENILVDQGPMLKRFLPRAMGRATPIHKKMSHVTLVLAEKEKAPASRFQIAVSKKTKLPKKGLKTEKPKLSANGGSARGGEVKKEMTAAKESVGFLRRIFRRKSV